MAWKERIWTFFGTAFQRIDKQGVVDIDGKGELQRFNEIIGEDIDEEIEPFIDEILKNTFIADTMYDRFIATFETLIGMTMRLSNDLSVRRQIIRIAQYLYKYRSTQLGYEVPLRMLGFESVTLEETWFISSWDSPVTLDDTIRRFDSGGRCQNCSGYALHLTGSLILTADIIKGIAEVILFNEPINARLTAMTYNGEDILSSLIQFIIVDGDLFYENLSLYDAEFSIDSQGNLIADGNDANRFRINNGDIFLDT